MKIINKKARFNYDLTDRFEAGIVLTGPEVKSARNGHVSLGESFVRLTGDELYLINATISPYKFAASEDYETKRSRKLLLHKKEIAELKRKMEGTNLTIVPTAMYTKNRRIKFEIALAKGKKQYEKKETKKRADLTREQERALKNYK
jgi:SsrA-binding protein